MVKTDMQVFIPLLGISLTTFKPVSQGNDQTKNTFK